MAAKNTHEHIPVKVAVAMSESGRFRVCIADSNWIQEERKHQEMLDEIRQDKQLWSLKYIKTTIPYPVSIEDDTQPKDQP